MILGCEELGTHLVAGPSMYDMFREGNFVAVLAITLGCTVGVIGIIGGTISSVVRSRAQEHTKRELAAYVAEGTLDPDKAVAILNSGRSKADGCCDLL